MIKQSFLFLLLVGLLVVLPDPVVYAQDVASIAQEIESVKTNSAIDDQTRASALTILNDARQLVVKANERAALVRGYEATASSAIETISQFRSDLAALQRQPAVAQSAEQSDVELNAMLNDLSAERTTLVELLGTLQSRQTNLNTRGEDIAREIAQARSDVDDLQGAAPAEESSSDPVASASITLYRARLAERQAAIDELSRERSTIAPRQSVLEARVSFVSARVERVAATIEQLQAQVGTTRTINARKWLESATAQLASLPAKPPALVAFAQENVDLARANLELVKSSILVAAETSRLQQDLVQVTASAQTVDQVLATGQLNDDTAELLRSVRARLANSDRLANATLVNDQTGVALRLNIILWQDRQRNLVDARETRKAALIEMPGEASKSELAAIADQLINRRLEFLQALIATAQEKSGGIADQRGVRQEVQQRTMALATLLDRRLLWLPTKSGFGTAFWKNISSNIKWLVSGAGWRDTGHALVASFSALRAGPVVLSILAVIIVLFAKTMRRRLAVLAARVGNVTEDTYLTTPEALVLSLLHTLPWPLAIGAVGLAMAKGSTTVFTGAISQGLYAMAAVIFILSFFRTLTRRNGVFHRHFGWSETSRVMLRRHLNWFILVEALVAFIFTAALASGDPVIKYGIGRLAFIVSSVAIALFAYFFLKPRDGIAISISADRQFTVTMQFLLVLLVAAPLTIGLFPIVGYYEAAIELQSRVFQSGIVILMAAVIYRLSMRLFLVGHRRVALKRAEQKLARDTAKRKGTQESDQSGDAVPTITDDKELNLDALSTQSRRTVKIIATTVLLLGLWVTWSALLPALGIANDVILWNGIRNVDGIAVSTGISLWDFMVALVLVLGGFIVARNVGGILELVVFERLSLDSGTRYATITIARYVLISFGIVVGFSRLGVDWSSLQWVIAALGVGLGFGLQEIVANFVSGLIILFERPVRVGDIVTIGQLEGTVTSIQIRATRITDFDNREVLMPNKSIITENVTNWTLNDQVTRIIIRVGVAYGSDIDKVREIILATVSGNADTLTNPSPAVFFMAHGDSSLDFEARVFVATPGKRLPVTHELNRGINLALASNGIEIPFPQRDLHIRSGGESSGDAAGE